MTNVLIGVKIALKDGWGVEMTGMAPCVQRVQVVCRRAKIFLCAHLRTLGFYYYTLGRNKYLFQHQ